MDHHQQQPEKDYGLIVVSKARKLFEDNLCSVCLESPQKNKSHPSCGHVFCFDCLVEWSKTKPECPLCKQKFTEFIHSTDKVHILPPQLVDKLVDVLGGSSYMNNAFIVNVLRERRRRLLRRLRHELRRTQRNYIKELFTSVVLGLLGVIRNMRLPRL